MTTIITPADARAHDIVKYYGSDMDPVEVAESTWGADERLDYLLNEDEGDEEAIELVAEFGDAGRTALFNALERFVDRCVEEAKELEERREEEELEELRAQYEAGDFGDYAVIFGGAPGNFEVRRREEDGSLRFMDRFTSEKDALEAAKSMQSGEWFDDAA